MSFMDRFGLILNAKSCRARREDDAVLLPLRERHVEEPQMRRVIRLRCEPLPLIERLILPLDGIAASFFISLSVGLLRVRGAPGLERLAEKQPAPRAERRRQQTALPRGLPSRAPPAAPTVSPTIRVEPTPAQPPSSAQATSEKTKRDVICMRPFYPAAPHPLLSHQRNRIRGDLACVVPTSLKPKRAISFVCGAALGLASQ